MAPQRNAHARPRAPLRAWSVGHVVAVVLLAACPVAVPGAAGVVEVWTAPRFTRSLHDGSKHIEVRAHIDVRAAQHQQGTFGLRVRGTRSIVGKCPEPVLCTVTADTGHDVFNIIYNSTRVWIHALRVRLEYRPPEQRASGSAVFRLSSDAWLWATDLALEFTEGSPPPVAFDAGTDADVRAFQVNDRSRAFVAGSSVKDMRAASGPIGRLQYGSGSVRTSGTILFSNSTFTWNFAARGTLFDCEAPPVEALRMRNVTFVCNTVVDTRCVADVWPRQVGQECSGDGVTWADLEMRLGDDEGVCGVTRGRDFLDGAEAELHQRAQVHSIVLPTPSLSPAAYEESCAKVWPCMHPSTAPSSSDPSSLRAPQPRESPNGSLFGFTLAVALAGSMALFLCTCCIAALARWCRLVHIVLSDPLQGGLYTPRDVYMGPVPDDADPPSAASEPHVFVAPRAGPRCLCRVFSPGDSRCLLCPICLRPFTAAPANGVDRRPKVLPCGHSACAVCAGKIDGIVGYAHLPWAQSRTHALPTNYPATDLLASAGGCGANPAAPSHAGDAGGPAMHRTTSDSCGASPASHSSPGPPPVPHGAPAAGSGPRPLDLAGSGAPQKALPGARGASLPLSLSRRSLPPGADAHVCTPGRGGFTDSLRGSKGADKAEPAVAEAPQLSWVDGVRRWMAARTQAPGAQTARDRPPPGVVWDGVFWSSAAEVRGMQWRPSELVCPICDNSLTWRPPEAGAPDFRPVVFPCGHGACADCASKIRHRGVCYERCEWQVLDLVEPFLVNKLVIGILQLAALDGGAAVPGSGGGVSREDRKLQLGELM